MTVQLSWTEQPPPKRQVGCSNHLTVANSMKKSCLRMTLFLFFDYRIIIPYFWLSVNIVISHKSLSRVLSIFYMLMQSSFPFYIDKSSQMWYNVHATQTLYFFSTMGKYFGKKCFLSFLIPSLRVCVATFEGSIFSVHSFGGALFYFWGVI